MPDRPRRPPSFQAAPVGWALLALLLAGGGASAQTAARTPECADPSLWRVLPDPQLRLEPTQALAASGWGEAPAGTRIGLPPGAYWLRVAIEGRSDRAELFLVEPDPGWHRVELYRDPARPPAAVTGVEFPLARRTVRHTQPLLPLVVPPGQRVELLLRLTSHPDRYMRPATFLVGCEPMMDHFEQELTARHLHGLYGGLMFAIVVYNLFLFFAIRDRIYLRYVLYAGSFGAIWLSQAGIGFELVWPGAPGWNEVSTFAFAVAAIFFGNGFVKAFLELPRLQPRVARVFDTASALALACGAAALLGLWQPAMDTLAVVAFAVCVLFLLAGVRALAAGFAPARIFLFACGALLAGTMAYVLAYFGLLPDVFLTRYGAQIGSALEMVLLAFALGNRIRVLEDEQRRAEASYLSRLEAEVHERTASLASEKARADAARGEAEQANRALLEANRLLEQMSLADDLTGLANRRRLDAALDAEWRRARRQLLPLAVVAVDVDNFKAYNDRYGHAAGDAALRAVGRVLAAGCRRAGDVAARYGGEEFVLLLPATDLAAATELAESVRREVRALAIEHRGGGLSGLLTISAGVAATVPPTDEGARELMAAADTALYAAKEAGRNRVVAVPVPRH